METNSMTPPEVVLNPEEWRRLLERDLTGPLRDATAAGGRPAAERLLADEGIRPA